MDWPVLISIFVSILLVAFFSGLESAFLSVNKLSIQLNKKQGIASGKTWDAFKENPTRFIGMLLVAANLVIILYGLMVGNLLFPIWKWIESQLPLSLNSYVKFLKILVETVISFSILLFVEFASRAWFRAKSNQMLRSGVVTNFALLFYNLFSSMSAGFISICEWILKYIFNVKVYENRPAFSKVDLENYFQQSKNPDEEESSELNKELFENALSLKDVRLRECLVPRKEIVSVNINLPISEARKKFMDTKLSKLVVYENNIDSILGYVHQLDLFRHPQTIREIMKPIPVVPESMLATDLMSRFGTERKSIAWVIDEFGGTAGIVTMEDLLEEIFGEIEDEYDEAAKLVEQQISNGEFLFSGRLELDYLSEKYHLPFHNEGGAETLSGFIIQSNGSIPRQKERIIIDNFEIEVMDVTDTRIELVKFKLLR